MRYTRFMRSYSIIGTGAIGGYYGGRLAEAGRTVSFLARSDYEYLLKNGLTVDSCAGDFSLPVIDVHNRASDLPERDVVVISLKTTANELLRELLSPIVREGTILLVLQNGLGMEGEIASWFPRAEVIGGMCFICCQKRNPGRISHLDYGSLTLAALDGDSTRARAILEELKTDFSDAKIPVTVSPSLGEARWRKLLWNIPYNGCSVILDCDTKVLMDTAASRRLVRSLMEEVVLGAAACGYRFEAGAVDRMLEFTDRMTPYEPSMKLDWDFGRPMEIAYMYRNPVEAARRSGTELPHISMLMEELLFLEERRHLRKPR